MTDINTFMNALRIPPLVYDWDISELNNTKLESQLAKNIPDVVEFVKERKHLFITVEEDIILASRIAVAILKVFIESGYAKVGYVTPSTLAEMKADSWKGGVDYENTTKKDLVVVDRVLIEELDSFKTTALWEFVEARALLRKSFIVASDLDLKDYAPNKITSILKASPVKRIFT